MKIYFRNKQKYLPVDWRSVKRLARFVLEKAGVTDVEIGILFVDNKMISRWTREYLQQDGPTDVIAFPIHGGADVEGSPELLGDIAVSAEKALEYAQKHNLGPHNELSLYLIHGLLHLTGYNDINIKERNRMFRRQRLLLNQAEREGLLIYPKP